MTPLLRTAAVAGTSLALWLPGGSPQAADGTGAERAALEARIQALNAELATLQAELDELPPGPTSTQTATQAGPFHTELVQTEAPRAPFSTQASDVAEPIAPDELAALEAEQRRRLELESNRNPFSITTYRQNYLFPVSYNSNPNRDAFRDVSTATGPDNAEVKFQFSAKVNLAEGLFGDTGDLYFAYTQRSWWQAYNTDASSPFRETNYEPELFISFDNAWRVLGWTNVHNRLALNHQSNGRSDPLSRSWNRIYLESTFQRGDWAFSVAPHWRIPESANEDDNPDIQRYMGYGDITVARRFGSSELSMLLRGNPSAGNMGTQFDYSWPLFGSNVRGHLQYYYGYGESMIDYDHRNHRLSLGFSLNPLFNSSGSMSH